MSPPRPTGSSSGFTIVELLSVVVVAAGLAALAIPALSGSVERARATRSLSNLRQLVLANQTYAAEHGRYAPADDRWNHRRWHGARNGVGGFDPAGGFLAPYLGTDGRVNRCPLFEEFLEDGQSFESGTGGYGYNAAYVGGRPGSPWTAGGLRLSASPAQIGNASRTVMFTSTAYARAGGLQEYPYCEPPFWDFGEGPSGARPSPSVHFRFRGKALVGWCDGHTSLESPTERPAGTNPHGGEASEFPLGWFGPDRDNGVWNSAP